jgi:hypothetical protein
MNACIPKPTAAGIAIVLFTAALLSAGEVESSLRPGDRLEPFQVKDCTGPAAGKTLCYYCRYGLRPVVAVLVREWSDEAEELIAQIDREVDLRRDARLAAFAIYLGPDTQATEEQLKSAAAKHNLARTPLTIFREDPAKLERLFGLPAAAKLMVVAWRDGEVQTVRAFDDAGLSGEGLRRALDDVGALAP